PLYAKSYALALYGSSFKNGYLNFRKDEFKYSGVDNELRKVLMVPGILLGILILFLIYTSASSYYELKNNVDKMEAQIAQVVKDTFPEVKVIPKPILYMQSEVGKAREKLDLIEGVQGGQTPLDALRDISSSLPQSLQLTVNDIKFESADKIKIQGVCGSYQEVAEIEEALEKSGMFETVTRNQTGNAQDGKTKFEISVVLKSKA
ncbi:MAG: PilN domain-containing protein, partial [Thermodesulfobacteriota bacterium]